MTSLREEIRNILNSDDAYNWYDNIDLDYCSDKILEAIEKRLDEYFKQREQKINDKTDFDHGYLQGLYDAKMEMLDDT